MKSKLQIADQINYMKNVNGIKFNLIDEADAAKFMKDNTYFFKLKSYAKNFEKYNHDRRNKYIDLDFAYLKELSKLDMHLRKIVLKMTLDIEHSLKVKLIRDITENDNEDGFSIVQDYFLKYPNVSKEIMKRSNGSACKDLISKYHDKYPVWVLVEILSFGDFVKLFQLYYSKNSIEYPYKSFLWSIRFIRNASAHNNCLLNNLRTSYSRGIAPNKEVNTIISKYPGIGKASRQKKMGNPMIHDLVVLIVAFGKIVQSSSIKKKAFSELKNLIDIRAIQNSSYFSKNDTIKSFYRFIKIVIDESYAKIYNLSTEQKQ